jgi:uncharacterized membrane protein YbhN (UPF0104 family)
VKWIAIAIKLAISGLLAWLVLKHVDFTTAGALLGSQRGAVALVLAMAILAGGAVVAGVRTAYVMRILGARCSVARATAVWMVGLVVSQSLITFIAGDAARVWQFVRHGYSPRTASSAVVLERALGFVVLLIMVLLFEPVLLARASPGPVRTGLLILAVMCAGGILAFVASAFLGRLKPYLPAPVREHRLVSVGIDVASAARHLTGSWKIAAVIILLSLLMQFCNVFALFVLARAIGVNLDLVATTAVALPALLIAAMPIAIAGWGVREGAMIVGYGLFGIAPAAALAISIAFGIAMLLVSLPGALFIRWGKQKQAPAPA